MTKNEDILKPFEVIERQTLEIENVVEKNKYFTILFFSQLYTQLDTCRKFHPYTSTERSNSSFSVMRATKMTHREPTPDTETRYDVIEKEMLAIVFALEKWHCWRVHVSQQIMHVS